MGITLTVLAPLILYKFILPSINIKCCEDNTEEISRNSLFWGFIHSSFLGLLVMIVYNFSIISAVSKISFWWLVLPVPLPLILFFIIDIVVVIACTQVFKQYKKKIHILVIMMTLFVQMMSYHSGWVILLLITYPLQVGTVILMLLNGYIALAFSCAFILQLWRKRRNKSLSINILFIGAYFFWTITYFLIAYYITLATYQHEDGITKFIPSLLPVVSIGFCTWITKNIIFKVIDYDKLNLSDYNNDKIYNSKSEKVLEDNENTPLQSDYKLMATGRTNKLIDSNV